MAGSLTAAVGPPALTGRATRAATDSMDHGRIVTNRMTRRRLSPVPAALLLGAVLGALPAVAAAHVHLLSATPEPDARLETAPARVIITFDGELDPTGSRFTVSGAGGVEVGSGEVDLTVADRNVLRGAVMISQPGVYTVEYVVVGSDGHLVTGSFTFEYRPGGSQGQTPDTALRADAMPRRLPVAALALALIAAGVATAQMVVRGRLRP